MERRFLFRANVPLQSCVARICHASPRRFFLAIGERNLRLDRSSAHCSLVIRSLSRSLPVFPSGGEVHASEVDQFIRSKHGSYVFAIRRGYRDQCAALSLL